MSGFYISRANSMDALVGLFEAFSNFSAADSERAFLELIILGRVPLTDYQVSFEYIVVPTILGVWLFIAYILYRAGVKSIIKRQGSKFDIAL